LTVGPLQIQKFNEKSMMAEAAILKIQVTPVFPSVYLGCTE